MELYGGDDIEARYLLEKQREAWKARLRRRIDADAAGVYEDLCSAVCFCVPRECWASQAHRAIMLLVAEKFHDFEQSRRFQLWKDLAADGRLNNTSLKLRIVKFNALRRMRPAVWRWRVTYWRPRSQHRLMLIAGLHCWKAAVRRRRLTRDNEVALARKWLRHNAQKYQRQRAREGGHPFFDQLPRMMMDKPDVRPAFMFWHQVTLPMAERQRALRVALQKVGVVRLQLWIQRWHEHATDDGERAAHIREAMERHAAMKDMAGASGMERHTAMQSVAGAGGMERRAALKALAGGRVRVEPAASGGVTRRHNGRASSAEANACRRQMLQSGFDALAVSAPRWEAASENVELRSGGSTLVHRLDRSRSGAIGSPAIRDGQIYRFGFLVGGGGSGIVLGVTDASPDATEAERLSTRVWGISLTHGATYTKKGVQRATLGGKSIAPPLSELHREQRCPELCVEVEVDMKAHRIAFSVDGTPLVHATDITLPSSTTLRPWAFLWNLDDRVMLIPRGRQRQPTMALAAQRVPLRDRPMPSPSTHRSLTSPQSHQPSPSSASHRSHVISPHQRSPSSSSLPPHTPVHVSGRPSIRSSRAAHTAEMEMPLTPTSYFGGRNSPARHASARTSARSARSARSAFDTPGHDEDVLPIPAPPLTPGKQKVSGRAHAFDYSLSNDLDAHQQQQRHGHDSEWDIVKHVTSLYNDVFQQLR